MDEDVMVEIRAHVAAGCVEWEQERASKDERLLAAAHPPGLRVVEVAERGALRVEVDVAVEVHGHLDGAVADDLHDDARVGAEREQQ